MHFSTLFAGAALFHLSIAGYVLEDDYMKDFYGSFDFFTEPDPTEGFVKYVDQSTAEQTGLINASTTNQVSWGVDHTNETPEGRPSVRITSKKSYNTALVVLDVEHMPTGCGTWPAFWMVGPKWPDNGEIDILEGVNDQETNAMTLHTGPGCAISSAAGAFTGELETDNCHVKAPDQKKNAGCSIKHPSKQSYGAGLNENKGGVYATHWTEEAISVYFFPRGEVPEDVLGDSPDPNAWGTPAAKFAGACDIASSFTDQRIVIDTTFCGVWAGNVWEEGSCGQKAATCEEYVRDNPEAFADAYWTINSLKVYTDNGEEPAPSDPVEPTPSSTAAQAPSAVPSETPTGSPPLTATLPVSTSDSPIQAPSSTSNASSETPLPTSTAVATSLPSASDAISSPTTIVPFPTEGLTAPASSLPPSPSVQPSTLPSTTKQDNGTTATRTESPEGTTPPPAPTDDTTNSPMPGFQWPIGGGGGDDNQDPVPEQPTTSLTQGTDPDVPAATQSSSASSPPLDTPTPSSAPPSPSSTRSTEPAIPTAPATTPTSTLAIPLPLPTDAVIETVYETIFVTAGAAPTPAPGQPRRRARQARQARRRAVQHNVRR